MKLRQLLPPVAAFALGALLLDGPGALGFVVTGDLLRLSQRDVRVFNNFSDLAANSNQAPDLSFPGYVGAELAIWKAVVEWGSELHLEGYGDPHQPGDLGSGGANFDPSWQGRAPGVGGPDENVHSQISGHGGGVLAFTEIPSSDGWRIRYYQAPWIWHDDPAGHPIAHPHADLQGVAAHEYGHALGLGHSADTFATMAAAVSADDVRLRSIEADDIAGIQFLYGARAPQKPRVATYQLAGGALTLHGSNFAPAGNEVWFTRAGGSPDGTPVMVSGLVSSQGGTAITLAVPAAAGPGDLLVKIPGQAHWSLSNAFPFDPAGEPCLQPRTYGTGKLNSTGQRALIGWTGQPSHSIDDFRITLLGVPGGQPGVLFWGAARTSLPFQGGELLVAPPLRRAAGFTIDVFGFASVPLPVSAAMVGRTRFLQLWFRDPPDPFGAGTSDALEVTFCR